MLALASSVQASQPVHRQDKAVRQSGKGPISGLKPSSSLGRQPWSSGCVAQGSPPNPLTTSPVPTCFTRAVPAHHSRQAVLAESMGWLRGCPGQAMGGQDSLGCGATEPQQLCLQTKCWVGAGTRFGGRVCQRPAHHWHGHSLTARRLDSHTATALGDHQASNLHRFLADQKRPPVLPAPL